HQLPAPSPIGHFPRDSQLQLTHNPLLEGLAERLTLARVTVRRTRIEVKSPENLHASGKRPSANPMHPRRSAQMQVGVAGTKLCTLKGQRRFEARTFPHV